MHGLCGKKDIQGPRYLFAYKQVFAKVVQLRIQKSSCLEMLNTSSFSWGNRTILLNVRMNKVVPISRNMCHDGLGIG